MVDLQIPENRIAFHLSDRALTPLISSSSAQPEPATTPSQPASQMQALTTVAITAYDSASRLGLGLPQRVMIESRSRGPVILHSYLNPSSTRRTLQNGGGRGIVEQARDQLRPLSSGTNTEISGTEDQQEFGNELVNGTHYEGEQTGEEDEDGEESSTQQPPLLIASVVTTSAAGTGEARQAAAKLEKLGRDFQQEWTKEQLNQNLTPETNVDEGDG